MNIKIRYDNESGAFENVIPTDRDGPLDAYNTIKVPSNLGEDLILLMPA